jgi:hypothetical protein
MAFAINNKNWVGKLIRMYIQALQFYGPKSNVSREKNFRYKIKSKTFNDIQLLSQHEIRINLPTQFLLLMANAIRGEEDIFDASELTPIILHNF